MRPRVRTLLLPLALLAGCASTYGPGNLAPGASADEVTKTLGTPTSRYELPAGATRLEFARGPFGKHTWMVDVDASQRITQIQQVLTEPYFDTIIPGASRDAVLLRLGRPSQRRAAFRDTELWSYRYDTPVCQWFVITMNPNATVRDAGYVPDPLCDAGDPGRPAATQ